MYPSAKRSRPGVPAPNSGNPKDYKDNAKPFNPGPINKGDNSTAGESELEAATKGTADDMSKT